jgi:hypothetical protein
VDGPCHTGPARLGLPVKPRLELGDRVEPPPAAPDALHVVLDVRVEEVDAHPEQLAYARHIHSQGPRLRRPGDASGSTGTGPGADLAPFRLRGDKLGLSLSGAHSVPRPLQPEAGAAGASGWLI